MLAYATVADDFAYLARTPGNAALKALEKIGMQPGDVDLWEINEAFASVAIGSMRILGIDETNVNVTAARSPSATRSAPPAPHHRLAGA